MSKALFPKKIYKGVFPEIVFYGCSAISFGYYIKNTMCLKHYQNYTTLNGNYGPVYPSDRLKSIYSAVERDVKDFTSQDTPIIPYIVPGLRVLHAGTIGTFQGGVIGLPLFFEFNDKEDVENKIKKSASTMYEESLEEFYNCFLLSDKAKKYAIAREVLCVNTIQVYIETTLPLVLSWVIKLACEYVIPLLNVHTSVVGGGLFYAIVLVSGLSIWRTTHSILTNYFGKNVEEVLATLGTEYIEGAIEFYSKALERRQHNLEWRDQNSRILKTISDKVNFITSRKEIPMKYKLAFYTSKLDASKNNNEEELYFESES